MAEPNIELFSLKEDGTRVLINDIENGGLRAFSRVGGAAFSISDISIDGDGNVTLQWNSRAGADYAVDVSPTLPESQDAWQEFDDGIPSEGAITEAVVDAAAVAGAAQSGQLYFRIREL